MQIIFLIVKLSQKTRYRSADARKYEDMVINKMYFDRCSVFDGICIGAVDCSVFVCVKSWSL